MAEKHNPLEQFEIQTLIPIRLGNLDISFTNSSAFMVLAVAAVAILMILAVRPRASIPGRWQILAELSYEFIARLVSDNIGKDGRPYFSFIFTIFMFVLFGNFLEGIPIVFPSSLIIAWQPKRDSGSKPHALSSMSSSSSSLSSSESKPSRITKWHVVHAHDFSQACGMLIPFFSASCFPVFANCL